MSQEIRELIERKEESLRIVEGMRKSKQDEKEKVNERVKVLQAIMKRV